jgi:hypothetical protein
MMSIAEFCELHYACKEGREWALANCKAMADVWVTACPGWLVWVATRPDVLDDRTLRLFAVFCARSVEHLLTDQRSRDAIDVAERFAKGEATAEELSAASDAARDAARSAARDAARAAWSAASDAASDAARAASDAASDAAWSAALSAALSAASDAARAARDAALSKQADWLRKNAAPNFERSVGDE